MKTFHLLSLFPLFCSSFLSSAQTNSWTSPTSAPWDSPNWSLGILPGAGQTILITNAGFKAVGINPGTVQTNPQTLHIAGLTISSPANSFNTLLLNFDGLGSPLVINGGAGTSQVSVASNSAVIVLSSALQVTNAGVSASSALISLGGTFTESDASRVTAFQLNVGDIGPGVFNLTNSLLQVTNEAVFTNGIFTQDGGTNSANPLQLFGGRYVLVNGEFDGTVNYLSPGSLFVQSGGVLNASSFPDNFGTNVQNGGTFNGQIDVIGPGSDVGTYILNGGTHTGDMIMPGGELEAGFVTQTGGTNNGSVTLGFDSGLTGIIGPGTYVLSNGVLNAPVISETGGSFMQIYGGEATVSNLALNGTPGFGTGFENSGFELFGGLLSAQMISMRACGFIQLGGTNQVGTFNMGTPGAQPNYSLLGGALLGSNFTCNGSYLLQPEFAQTGGLHAETNLSLYFSTYNFSGGQLSVSNLQLTISLFYHLNGTFTAPPFVGLSGSTWQEQTNGAQLGPLRLTYASPATNSSILLPTNTCTLRFANSSGVTWSNLATLTIEHWAGSLPGGGLHQIFFGTDGTGLTGAQLGQVRFHNPDGIQGLYPATILSTGEIVPAGLLEITPVAGQFRVQWDGAFTLETATNILGPYLDVTTTGDAYTNQLSGTQRFFRLK